jgi:hypothetical protein
MKLKPPDSDPFPLGFDLPGWLWLVVGAGLVGVVALAILVVTWTRGDR